MIYTVSKGRNDGVGYALVEKLNVNMPIVFVSLSEDLEFNEQVLELAGKPYCLFSFVELGWSWDRTKGHEFGKNTEQFPNVFHMDSWKVFDDFVKNNPPAISFYRELLVDQLASNVLPISYPCFISQQPIQTKEEFNNRVFEVFFSFGISHEYRKELHGSIWALSGKYGYSVLDNIYLLPQFIENEKTAHKWLSTHIAWWARQPIETITAINTMAKLSISPAGAGRNCFRHLEIPTVSAMLMWEDNTAWHKKDWVHGVNCIKCEQGKEIETAIEWLAKPDELYNVYVEGTKTVDKFRFLNYIPYLTQLINNA